MNLKYQASRLFNLLTVVILCLLCVLLNDLTKINFHRLDLPRDKPEFSATGMRGNLYAPNGTLLYQFSAESGNQFPNSSKITLLKLSFTAYSESNASTSQQLTSANGWFDTKTSQGFLGESVEIIIANSQPQQVVRIYTHSIALDGIKRYAHSSAPIRATQGKSVLTGLGVSVDGIKQIITIESQVKIVYVK